MNDRHWGKRRQEHTLTNTQTHKLTHIHIHTLSLSISLSHTHTQSHTQQHTHTQKHTHTHTHGTTLTSQQGNGPPTWPRERSLADVTHVAPVVSVIPYPSWHVHPSPNSTLKNYSNKRLGSKRNIRIRIRR